MKKPNFILKDKIESEAYLALMISCELCNVNLMASDLGIEAATDPMEKWSKQFANAAKSAGWAISPTTGSILCPECYRDNHGT